MHIQSAAATQKNGSNLLSILEDNIIGDIPATRYNSKVYAVTAHGLLELTSNRLSGTWLEQRHYLQAFGCVTNGHFV